MESTAKEISTHTLFIPKVYQFLYHKLSCEGFEGNENTFFRRKSDRFERISLRSSKNRKFICVNLEIKLIKEPNISNEAILAYDSFPTHFDKWKRLTPDDNDNWWPMLRKETEANNVMKEIQKLIDFEAPSFFSRKVITQNT